MTIQSQQSACPQVTPLKAVHAEGKRASAKRKYCVKKLRLDGREHMPGRSRRYIINGYQRRR